MPKEADFYTPGEAAKLLGLAEMTVLGLLTAGQLEAKGERIPVRVRPGDLSGVRRSERGPRTATIDAPIILDASTSLPPLPAREDAVAGEREDTCA